MKVRFTFLKHKRPKLEMGMQRECVASGNPVGWKGKKLLAALYGQICTAGVCFLSAGSRNPSVQGGEIQICFLVGGNRPSVLSRKGIREALKDATASTNSLFVLIGCLNKYKLLIWLSCNVVISALRLYPRPKLNRFLKSKLF